MTMTVHDKAPMTFPQSLDLPLADASIILVTLADMSLESW